MLIARPPAASMCMQRVDAEVVGYRYCVCSRMGGAVPSGAAGKAAPQPDLHVYIQEFPYLVFSSVLKPGKFLKAAVCKSGAQVPFRLTRLLLLKRLMSIRPNPTSLKRFQCVITAIRPLHRATA